MSSKLQRPLTVSVRLVGAELAGPGIEERPYIAMHGTWTNNRTSAISSDLSDGAWTDVGSFSLPPTDWKEPDNIWFKLYCHTRTTGIPILDELEGPHITREIPCGLTSVTLRELATLYEKGEGEMARLALIDNIVVETARSRLLLALANNDSEVLVTPSKFLTERQIRVVGTMALNYAYKGTLEVRLKRPLGEGITEEQLSAYGKTPPPADTEMVYGTTAMNLRANEIFSRLHGVYIDHATSVPPVDIKRVARGERWEHNKHEPLVKDLHMVEWKTDRGRLLPIDFTKQDASTRIGESDETALQGEDLKKALNFVETNLMGSLLRHGMSPSRFTHIIDTQLKERGDKVHASFLTAIAALGQTATFVANAVSYSSDRRFPNVAWLQKQDVAIQQALAPEAFAEEKKEGGETVSTAHRISKALASAILHVPLKDDFTQSSSEISFRSQVQVQTLLQASATPLSAAVFAHRLESPNRRLHVRLADSKDGKAKVDEKKTVPFAVKCAIACESWDTAPFSGESTTGDCEDTAYGPLNIMESIKKFAKRVDDTPSLQKSYPLLHASVNVFARFHAHSSGSTVTEAYVRTTAGEGGLKKVIILPRIGSAADKEMAEGGHSLGMFESRARLLKKHLDGLDLETHASSIDSNNLRQGLTTALQQCAPWEHKVPPFILEGTGPVAGYVEPAYERYKGTDRVDVMARKQAAVSDFVSSGLGKISPEFAAIASFARFPTQPHDIWARKEADRRVSTFYRTYVHSQCPALAEEFGHNIGHAVTVLKDTRERGVDIGTYFTQPEKVSYGHVFAGAFSEIEWKTVVEPYCRSILNQLPVSTWAREPTRRMDEIASPIPTASISALAGYVPPSLTMDTFLGNKSDVENLAKFPPLDRDSIAQIQRVDESNDRAIVPLSVPAWKLKAMGPGTTADMISALDKMKKQGTIITYAWLKDRPLRHLNEVVTLMVVLPVPDKVDETKFPRPK